MIISIKAENKYPWVHIVINKWLNFKNGEEEVFLADEF